MSELNKARLHSVNIDGSIGEDVDVYTSGDAVILNNGKTLENIYENEVGDVSKLNTTNKDLVNAVNENTYNIGTNTKAIENVNTQLSSITNYNKFSGKIALLDDLYTGFTQQGITSDGTYFYIAVISGSTNNLGKILKYEIATGSLIGIYEGVIYHANCLCVDKGVLYSADCIDQSTGNSVLIGSISKFNTSDMSFISRITTDLPSITGIGILDDKLYAVSNNNNVYTINNDGTHTTYCTLEANTTGTTQGIAIDKNFIYYVRSNPNVVLFYKHNGTLQYIYEIGAFVPNCYVIDELEDMCVVNGKIYFGSATVNKANYVLGNVQNNDILVIEGKFNDFTTDNNFIRKTGIVSIYCDSTTITKKPNGTIMYPFKRMQQALNYILTCNTGRYNILLQGKMYPDFLIMENTNAYEIRITGGNATISGGIKMYDGSLYITGVILNCDNLYNLAGGSSSDICKIGVQNSNHGVVNLSLDGISYTATSLLSVGYAVQVINTLANIYFNCTYDANTNMLINRCSGNGCTVKIIDSGLYQLPFGHSVQSNNTTARYYGTSGQGRLAQLNNMRDVCLPNINIDLSMYVGAPALGSIVKLNFVHGTIIVPIGGSGRSIGSFYYSFGGNLYLVRINANISGNILNWTGSIINLGITPLTEVTLSNTNYISTYECYIDSITII
jgi:hypothetical protein